MNRLLKTLVAFVVLCSVLSTAQGSALAATSMPFSINAILPENQADKTVTYFDLNMKPGDKQEVEVEIMNAGEKPVTVENQANAAITNDNGIVDFSYTGNKFDKTLKHPFSQVAKIEKEVTLPPKGKKRVKVKLDMPKEKFDGVILGGLRFTEKENKDQKKQDKEGVQIENKYAFVIGFVLRETDKKIKPSFKLGSIKPAQDNFRNVLKANISNTEATIVTDMEIQAKVTKKGQEKALFESSNENLRMAPNSNFNYGINWENKPFKSGQYTLHMTLKADGKKWQWNEEFEIEGKDAKKLNEQAVELEKDYTMYYIIGGAVLVILMLIAGYLLGRRGSKKKNEKADHEDSE
ncbi:DUF916 and DUF3324 domain-containing protein [Listeria kieliensis]